MSPQKQANRHKPEQRAERPAGDGDGVRRFRAGFNGGVHGR